MIIHSISSGWPQLGHTQREDEKVQIVNSIWTKNILRPSLLSAIEDLPKEFKSSIFFSLLSTRRFNNGDLIEVLKKNFAPKILNLLDAHIQKLFNEKGKVELTLFKFRLNVFVNIPQMSIYDFIKRVKSCIGSKQHDDLIDLLPEEAKENFPVERLWLDELKLKDLCKKRLKKLQEITKDAKCVNGVLNGYFPKISQIKKGLNNDIRDVMVFGYHTVTIDEDLVLPGVNVTIISPRWDISSNRKIILSGESAATFLESCGEPGADGAPGLPGSNGGRFFGLGEKFTGLNHLTIQSNGGNGSRGQNGGKGHDGRDGVDSEKKYGNVGSWDEPAIAKFKDIKKFFLAGCKNEKTCVNFGKPGERGGDGGKGGKGGIGGHAGNVEIIMTSGQIASCKISVEKGKHGLDGKAGEGGLGGRHGRDWYGVWRFIDNKFTKGPTYCEGGERKPAGSSPTDKNTLGQNAPPALQPSPITSLLGTYKVYQVKEGHLWTTHALETFRQSFENNPKIKRRTTLNSLIEECEQVEEIGDKTLPLYKSLLFRIENHKTTNIALLESIHSFVLSKICQIEAASKCRLVIDIKGFLEQIVKNVDALNTLEKNRMIQEYRNDYVSQIKVKIDQADLFIQRLNHDIKAAHGEINKQIYVFIEEIRDLIKLKEAAKIDLEESKEKLKMLLGVKALLGSFSITLQTIGLCFPLTGTLMASIANAGLTFAGNPSLSSAVTEIEKISMSLKSYEGDKTSPKKEELKKCRITADSALQIIRPLSQLQNDLNFENLQHIEQEIKKADEQLKQLDQMEKQVPELHSFLDHFVELSSDLQKALQEKSLIAREYSRLEVIRSFEEVKKKLRPSMQAFTSCDGFIDIVKKMEQAIETSMNIYDRIQDYKDRITLAKYMANIAQSSTVDPQMEALRLKAKRNVILEQYSQAVSAVQQWAFPFGHNFLGDFSDLTQFTQKATVKEQCDHIKEKLMRLQEKVNSYATVIHSQIDTAQNTAENMTFYVWNNTDDISALLKGEQVVLYADVNKSPENKSAIKFSRLELEIKGDKSLSHELKMRFKVDLVHSGDSFYRVNQKIYRMSNDGSLNLVYSFDKNEKNGVHQKIEEGDFILSPYTHWTVQLIPEDKQNDLYDKFKERVSEIEIHLTGKGQYVDEAKTVNLNLEPYSQQLLGHV